MDKNKKRGVIMIDREKKILNELQEILTISQLDRASFSELMSGDDSDYSEEYYYPYLCGYIKGRIISIISELKIRERKEIK